MSFKLNDLKRSLAESTYQTVQRRHVKNSSISQMIEESKATLRSTEPYIGGEKETGVRIYRNRDKARELGEDHHNRSVQNHAPRMKTLIPKRISHKAHLSNSIETTS